MEHLGVVTYATGTAWVCIRHTRRYITTNINPLRRYIFCLILQIIAQKLLDYVI